MTGEVRSYQTGAIPVYDNGDRKLAYIDENNWSKAVILPSDSSIDIYTDKARDCSILMMNINKADKEYILLSHILYRNPVKQIENIKETLGHRGFNINNIVFSPRIDSNNLQEAIESIESSAADDTEIIRRSSREMACGLVTSEGWVLNSGLKKNRKTILDLWKKE